ncbi:MAG: tetratricopeptide repeat protein [Planctomycetota bacterium]
MRPRIAIGLAAAALLAAGAARSDDVVLKNGTRLEGKVQNPKCEACRGSGKVRCPACHGTGKTRGPGGMKLICRECATGKVSCAACGGLGAGPGKIRVKLRAGVTMEIDRQDVKSLAWKHVDPESLVPVRVAYQKKAAGLREGDARGHYRLAKWCLERKLGQEARKHFEAAVKLDPAQFGKLAEPHLAELNAAREKVAVKALLAALAAWERGGAEQGVAAVRAVQRDFPEAEIIRRPELQGDLIRNHFPKLAAAGADTLEGLLRSAADRSAARCPRCAGKGKSDCPACAGSGAGRCPDCRGSGKRVCPICTGSLRLTCTKCYGAGRTSEGTIGYGKRQCPQCSGVGEVSCDFCRASGRADCRACKGTARRAGTCRGCAGKGRVVCAACAGTAVRRVAQFKWGPPPVRKAGVVNVVGPGVRARAWQGELGGAAITVVPAEVIWRGALTRNVERLTGKRLQLVTVALDNRKGRKLLRFRVAGPSLRGVNADAEQVSIIDLGKALAAKASDRQAQLVIAAAGDTDCLPGAYACVLAAFPAGTDLSGLTSMFWVQDSGEPARLGTIWLSADEIEEVRKSVR